MSEDVPDDLTEAERFLVTTVSRGEPVDLKRHVVRASILRDLILEARPGWVVPHAGLRLHKAIVDGGLDLEGCTIMKPLLFWHSRLQGGGDRGTLLVRDARLKRLGIHSCTIEGAIIADRVQIESGLFLGGGLVKGVLQIRGADVNGALAIEGTEIGDGKSALLAAGLRLSGPLILRRARAKGEVAFPRAEIGAGIYAEDAVVVHDGIAITGESARIKGDILLDRANVTGSVKLSNASVGGQVSAEALVIASTPDALLAGGLNVAQGLNLSAARVAGAIWLEGAEIGKVFRAEGIEIWGSDTAIAADVVSVGGNWDMARAKLFGQLSCPGAEIKGQLRLTESRIYGKEIAIRGDGARIRGGCFLSRAVVTGALRFPAAEVGNQFRLTGATLKVEEGASLFAAAAKFGRDVELGEMQCVGAIVLDQAHIRGSVVLRDATLISARLARSGAPPAGPYVGVGAERADAIALSLLDADVDRLELPARVENRPRGIIDLSRAHVGSYEDYAAAWPPAPLKRGRSSDGRDIDHLVLDGFTYEHLRNPAGAERGAGTHARAQDRVGERRVSWLEGQEEGDIRDHFKPQAWVQLSSRLAAQGYHDDARVVTIARRRRERQSHSASAGHRWQGRILDLFALYGYNPWRTVMWMAAFVLFFTALWTWAAGHCTDRACLDEGVFVVSNRDAYTQDGFAQSYPPFNALAYSFDVFVPFVSFGYEDHWRPNLGWKPFAEFALPVPAADTAEQRRLALTGGGLLYLAVIVEMILGLVLTSLAITGFTGLLRGEE